MGRLADLQGAARPEIADVAALAEAVGGARELADRRGSAGAGSRPRSPRSTTEPPTIQASSSQVVVLVTRLRAPPTVSRPGVDLHVDGDAVRVVGSRSTAKGWCSRSAKASRILLSIWPTSLCDARLRPPRPRAWCSAAARCRDPVSRRARSISACAAGGVGRIVDQLGQQRHLARDAERQPAGHRVPMPVVEDVGEHELQDQQRHDGRSAASARTGCAARSVRFSNRRRPRASSSTARAAAHSPSRAWSGCSAAGGDRPRSCGAAAPSARRPPGREPATTPLSPSSARLTDRPGLAASACSSEISPVVRWITSSWRRSSDERRLKLKGPKRTTSSVRVAWTRRRMVAIRSSSSRGSNGLAR